MQHAACKQHPCMYAVTGTGISAGNNPLWVGVHISASTCLPALLPPSPGPQQHHRPALVIHLTRDQLLAAARLLLDVLPADQLRLVLQPPAQVQHRDGVMAALYMLAAWCSAGCREGYPNAAVCYLLQF